MDSQGRSLKKKTRHTTTPSIALKAVQTKNRGGVKSNAERVPKRVGGLAARCRPAGQDMLALDCVCAGVGLRPCIHARGPSFGVDAGLCSARRRELLLGRKTCADSCRRWQCLKKTERVSCWCAWQDDGIGKRGEVTRRRTQPGMAFCHREPFWLYSIVCRSKTCRNLGGEEERDLRVRVASRDIQRLPRGYHHIHSPPAYLHSGRVASSALSLDVAADAAPSGGGSLDPFSCSSCECARAAVTVKDPPMPTSTLPFSCEHHLVRDTHTHTQKYRVYV